MSTHLYTPGEENFIISTAPQAYQFKIRDLPSEDKPREKLQKYGPDIMSLSELLAVVFMVGSKKEDVLTMSRRLLKEYGGKSLLGQKNPRKLSQDLEIPTQKACQLIACLELGRRFFYAPGSKPEFLRTARQVYDYLKDMHNLPKEHLRGLYLNNHYRLIHDEVISIGSLDANIIHPREVFKPAIEYSASAVILAHNHPSGISKPSLADIDITAQLVAAGKLLGVYLLDHVIVARDGFSSIPVNYE
jgi:DNA repair protein RadC